MRVITGKYRGRKLNTPQDYDIRPTSDKAKEALFSILANQLYDSRILDVFAGTGSLGIEALSRGASYCLFADASGKSLKLVKENLEHCKVEEKTRVAAGDYKKILKNLADRIEDGLEEPFVPPHHIVSLLYDENRLFPQAEFPLSCAPPQSRHRWPVCFPA